MENVLPGSSLILHHQYFSQMDFTASGDGLKPSLLMVLNQILAGKPYTCTNLHFLYNTFLLAVSQIHFTDKSIPFSGSLLSNQLAGIHKLKRLASIWCSLGSLLFSSPLGQFCGSCTHQRYWMQQMRCAEIAHERSKPSPRLNKPPTFREWSILTLV